MIKLYNIFAEITDKGLTLYCDLDGVLCDFEGGFKKLSGGLSFEKHVAARGVEEAWKLINNKGASFWANLEWMPDGQTLWKAIKRFNPTILSAPSSDPSSIDGKKMWVRKNLGNVKAIYTPAKQKQEYANDHSILIDDYDRNIKQWSSKGGIAIHHKNTQDTLKQLQQYL